MLALPTPTYIRVFPLGKGVTANDARSVFCAVLRALLICVHVEPPSLERQMPPLPATFCGPKAPAYRIRFVVPFQPGSRATSFTPRIVAFALVPLHVTGQASPPSQMKLKVLPPSLDS